MIRLVQEVQPNEIYNLGAQSHVHVSFETPEFTASTDALGVLRLLEAIRILKVESRVRFYQAPTSELYGEVQEVPQSETTPFSPRSPYGATKLYGFWITKNYRESYSMHASNGILFSQERPLRGEKFAKMGMANAARFTTEAMVGGYLEAYQAALAEMAALPGPEVSADGSGRMKTPPQGLKQPVKRAYFRLSAVICAARLRASGAVLPEAVTDMYARNRSAAWAS